MSSAASQNGLLDLAKSRNPADRERLLLSIADMCEADNGAGAKEPTVQALLNSIFMNLVVEAERDIRKRLAERLSKVDWAPPALINVLALDEIEIARPIIASSPLLQDADLVRLLVEATIEHQIEVARRPNLSEVVVGAILRLNEGAVLTALAGNPTALVTDPHMAQLVETARRLVALRTPLSQHPKLTSELALQLYVWVGQALRQSLTERFRLDPDDLQRVLLAATQEAHAGHSLDASLVVAREGEQQAMEQRPIDKLHAAGQLRPGYLVRALREGRLSMFVIALATLGRFDPAHIRMAIDSDRPELLALACAAVSIDRSVFPTILTMVRPLNGGMPTGAEGPQSAADAYTPFHAKVAEVAFRQATAAAG